MATDPLTTGWRAANPDLGDVGGPVVNGIDLKRGTFAELTGLFHGPRTSAVLLDNVDGSTRIHPGRKLESSLAAVTTDETCVHGSQGDEDQYQ